jgi:hypothetical protein
MAEPLEKRFDDAMHELYARIVRECDGRYHPTIPTTCYKTMAGWKPRIGSSDPPQISSPMASSGYAS